jgi:hypothetical protein
LDAARLNLIGGEAKKALNRAARARVVELKDIKAHGHSHEALDSATLKRHKRKGSKDKHGKKSESRRSEHGEAVPPWVNDVSLISIPSSRDMLINRSCHV